MRKRFLIGLLIVSFMFGLAMTANALQITVSQDGNILGTIESYSGTETAVENYNFYSSARHVIHGPTPNATEAQIFFYEGSDGLSFNIGLSKGGTIYDSGKVRWDITVAGSTTDPVVLVSDDYGELKETNVDVLVKSQN